MSTNGQPQPQPEPQSIDVTYECGHTVTHSPETHLARHAHPEALAMWMGHVAVCPDCRKKESTNGR